MISNVHVALSVGWSLTGSHVLAPSGSLTDQTPGSVDAMEQPGPLEKVAGRPEPPTPKLDGDVEAVPRRLRLTELDHQLAVGLLERRAPAAGRDAADLELGPAASRAI